MSYSRNTHKILSIVTFLVLLIVAVILIAQFRNIAAQLTELNISLKLIYFLIALIIIAGITSLFQILSLTAEKVYTDEYTKKSYLTDIYNMEEENKADETIQEEEKIDIEPYESKILPDEKSKLDLEKFCEQVLINISKEFDIVQGLFYTRNKNTDIFTICGKFAYFGEEEPADFELGVTLPGQTVKNQKVLNLPKIPENYVTILSGLGSSSPNSLMMIPVLHDEKPIGLIEIASFKDFDNKTEKIFSELSTRIGSRLSTKLT
jgi:putative methionine-R-sulfoxide reductase with GAF domain